MKILVVGCKGQLGVDMMLCAEEAGYVTAGYDVPAIDITDPRSVESILEQEQADHVINCAAYTAVDACEGNETVAHRVNAEGVEILGRAADRRGMSLTHISTDYVFDGLKRTPYVETDMPNPRSAYGRTKYAGEQALSAVCSRCRVFRIAWLYGAHGKNFVGTIRRLAKQRLNPGSPPLKVVHDQWGSPTWTVEVCRQILALVGTNHFGVFHATAEGKCTWYDFARLITEEYGVKVDMVPCTTAEFPRPAPRPAWSVLENRRLKSIGLNRMRPWEEAFLDFVGRDSGEGSRDAPTCS